MDPRLVRKYEQELQYLRELGAEFAEEFPKIAARLGMAGLEVADPYVERLLEGVAFLAARVQLKLDAEHPRFTEALLEIAYPQFLSPVPSMLVAQFRPDFGDSNLATGVRIPRGTAMRGLLGRDDVTACDFRTAHDITLWPVELVGASYFSFAPDLPLSALPGGNRVKGGVRLRLKAHAGLKFSDLALDRLPVFIGGRPDVAHPLHELLMSSLVGALVLPLPVERPPPWQEFLRPESVRQGGLADDEALLPVTPRSFQGYRLLQEYFAFPERYQYVEIAGLARALRRAATDEIEVTLLFSRGDPKLESLVDAGNFALYSTPAVNLFSKRIDRVHVNDASFEFHLVPDRSRPLDYEIYSVVDVTGHGAGADSERTFRPFYATFGDDVERHGAFYTVRREQRLVSSAQRRRGGRSRYVGTELFMSLVDGQQGPFAGDLRQLSVEALCTNRDLVLQMPRGIGTTDFALDIAAPVTECRVIAGPSRPYAPIADAERAWRALSQLSLNYLSLQDAGPEHGASALRDLLELYSASGDVVARRQIEALRHVQARPVTRRLPVTGTLSFGRGLEITIEVDEHGYEGASAFLLGSVLAAFLARHVSINSFTETVLRSLGRGEIHRWMPTWGKRPIL